MSACLYLLMAAGFLAFPYSVVSIFDEWGG